MSILKGSDRPSILGRRLIIRIKTYGGWDLGELGLADRRSALEVEDIGERMSHGSSGKVVVVGCFLGELNKASSKDRMCI